MSKWTKEEIEQHRQDWLDALRSGKYEQAKTVLANIDEKNNVSYCCLGVACELAKNDLNLTILEVNNRHRNTRCYAYNDDKETLPPNVQEYYGISQASGEYSEELIGNDGPFTTHYSLAEENDNGLSFKEIADIIESKPTGLFSD